MGEILIVHPRVRERHPELTEADVVFAWSNSFRSAPRLKKNPDEYVSVGFDNKGRLIEMIALRSKHGEWLIYHAKTPPTKKIMAELDGERR